MHQTELSDASVIRRRRLKQGGTYFSGRWVNHIKFQNFVKVSNKTKRKCKTSPSINQNNIKYLPSRQEPVKVYSRNSGTRWEVCPKLTIKTPERHNWDYYSGFIVNFELLHILFQCFYCWLWTSNCQLGKYKQFLQCFIVLYLFNMHFRIDATSIWYYF